MIYMWKDFTIIALFALIMFIDRATYLALETSDINMLRVILYFEQKLLPPPTPSCHPN
jgi:hypothetical protein